MFSRMDEGKLKGRKMIKYLYETWFYNIFPSTHRMLWARKPTKTEGIIIAKTVGYSENSLVENLKTYSDLNDAFHKHSLLAMFNITFVKTNFTSNVILILRTYLQKKKIAKL